MTRSVSTAAVGKVNRRFLLLALILAALSAVLVYAGLSRSGDDPRTGLDVPVVYTTAEIPAGTRITPGMLTIQQVPDFAVTDGAFDNINAVVGSVTRYPLAANDQVLVYSLISSALTSNDAISYVIEDGLRGMAITVEQVVNVGGLVLPGDHVDVLWVPAKGAPAFLLLSDLEVTAVSQTIVEVAPEAPGLAAEPAQEEPPASEGPRARTSDADPQPEAITATLMLSSDQAKVMFCAEEFARSHGGAVRLAVRSFGDARAATVDAPPCPAPQFVTE